MSRLVGLICLLVLFGCMVTVLTLSHIIEWVGCACSSFRAKPAAISVTTPMTNYVPISYAYCWYLVAFTCLGSMRFNYADWSRSYRTLIISGFC